MNSPQDIQYLVQSFYQKLLSDDRIKDRFDEIVGNDLEAHLKLISQFWESVLLGTAVYNRNAMLPHLSLHERKTLNADDFDIWLTHWKSSVPQHLHGEMIVTAIARAESIAMLMKHKMNIISP